VRSHRASRVVALVAIVAGLILSGSAAGADEGDRGSANNDGNSLTGNAENQVPGQPVNTGNGGPDESGGSGGPNCTKRDGTRGYLRYEGLVGNETQEEFRRTTPTTEDDGPGVWRHIWCDDEYVDFVFFPDGEPGAAPVDPRTLADSVTLTPPAPVIRTSPAAGDHLVDVEAWFWVDTWDSISETATAGAVTVTVTAEPTELIVDPGDGSPALSCVNPPAFDDSLSADAQSSDCTHVYEVAGNVTATARLVYETSFTSNVGAGGGLGTIEPTASADLAVAEAQAINQRD
jgi:hypothetical protein